MRQTTALFCLFLLGACASQGDLTPRVIDKAPLSDAAMNSLETSMAKAKSGSTNAHFFLGLTFCGELCLTHTDGMDASQKKIMADRLDEVRHLNITPDYVRAYAHFLLADDATTSEEGYRKLLEPKMSSAELEAAHQTAANWKAAAASAKKEPLKPVKKAAKRPAKKSAN